MQLGCLEKISQRISSIHQDVMIQGVVVVAALCIEQIPRGANCETGLIFRSVFLLLTQWRKECKRTYLDF